MFICSCLLCHTQPRQQRELKEFGHQCKNSRTRGTGCKAEPDGAKRNYSDSEERGLICLDFFKANRLYAYPIIQLVAVNASETSRYHVVARFYFALVAYFSSSVYTLKKK